MSGFRGGRGGRGDRGGFGNFRGGGSGRGRGGFQQSYGPPATVQEMGAFLHPCEGEIVCSSINAKIPHFNAPIFLENKTQIGKVEEVFGPINQVHFTIKTQDGIQATSFKPGDKFYIGDEKLLPLERFLPKPKPALGAPKPKKTIGDRGRGGRGGGRGGPRGGRGAPRGAPRGRGGGFGGGFSSGGRGGRGGGGFSSGRGGPPRGGSRGYSSRGR